MVSTVISILSPIPNVLAESGWFTLNVCRVVGLWTITKSLTAHETWHG